MEHNIQSPGSAHWGYTIAPILPPSQPAAPWAPPPQTHALKRSISESDCEELYSEESSKEQISPSDSGSCQLLSRKKRRGVIEKKRRDRINSSLSELKRLVPSAYEKQGSAKLEKAEILQLTVEHLKNLHSKGMDSINYDPQKFAMDYHIVGFRECAAEVARYLVTIEGMDIQDPLRLRLMSHLQYFVQQRELSIKSCSNQNNWTAPICGNGYQPNCAVSSYDNYQSAMVEPIVSSSTYIPNLSTSLQHYPTIPASQSSLNIHIHSQQLQNQATSHHIGRSRDNSATSSNDQISILDHNNSTQHQSQTSQQAHTQTPTSVSHETRHQQVYTHDNQHQEHSGNTYTDLTNVSSEVSHRNPTTSTISEGTLTFGHSPYPVSVSQEYNTNTSHSYVTASSSKPYRPWGAEMVY